MSDSQLQPEDEKVAATGDLKKLPQYEANVADAFEETARRIRAGEVFDREPTSRDLGDE